MSIFYKDKKHAESYCVVLTLVKMFWKFLISFELQNTYKSWHGLASLLSFNFTVTYGMSNFFIAKAYMNVFFWSCPVLSCPVLSCPVLWVLSHVMLCKNRHWMKWIRHKAGVRQTSVASHIAHHSHQLRID